MKYIKKFNEAFDGWENVEEAMEAIMALDSLISKIDGGIDLTSIKTELISISSLLKNAYGDTYENDLSENPDHNEERSDDGNETEDD